MIYISIITYLLFIIYKYELNGSPRGFYKYHIFFTYLILALVAGLRYRLGSDAYYYEFFINNSAVSILEIDGNYLINSMYQPGWLLICSIAKYLGHYLYLQIFVAFVSVFSVYFFLKKNTSYVASSTLFFFIAFYHYFSVEILREALAISLFLGAITVYENRKNLSLVLCLASLLFHKFAIFTILIYFFLRLNLGIKGFIFIMSAIILTIAYFEDPLIRISTLYSVIADINFESYALDGSMTIFGYLLYICKIVFPLIIALYGYIRRHSISEHIPPRIFYVFCGLISSIYLIRIISLPYAERLTNYFIIFVIAYGATLLILFFKKQNFAIRNIMFSLVFLASCIFTWLPLTKPNDDGLPGYSMYYPYYSYLNPGVDKVRQARLESRYGDTEW